MEHVKTDSHLLDSLSTLAEALLMRLLHGAGPRASISPHRPGPRKMGDCYIHNFCSFQQSPTCGGANPPSHLLIHTYVFMYVCLFFLLCQWHKVDCSECESWDIRQVPGALGTIPTSQLYLMPLTYDTNMPGACVSWWIG